MSKELKILINNEEVVCDKQISIDEKMLSTSSTILKNCYPKFWETDKDYVSRFYFPKDYSKCRISYDEFHPEDQGEIVTGTNLSINYDNTKNFELLQLQGNTYQQTYTGKNLLNPVPDVSSINGVTVSYNSATQEITLNGTCTTNNSVVAFGESSSSSIYGNNTFQLLANTTLYLRIKYISGTSTGQYLLAAYNNNFGTGLQALTTSTGQDVTNSKSWSYDTTFTKFRLRFENGTKFNNYKIKVYMSTTDNNYEPFVGRTPSPNPDYPQPIQNVTGRQVIDVVGKNLLNTNYMTEFTPTQLTWYSVDGVDSFYNETQIKKSNVYYDLKANTTYTLSVYSASNKSTSASNPIQLVNPTGTVIANISQSETNVTFTPSSNVRVYPRMLVQSANTSTQCVLQLEQGSTATTYEEYKKQSYEINLGKNLYYMNYNDTTNSNWNGVDITSTHTGYSISGTATSNTAFTLVNRYITLPAGTYTMSLKEASSMTIRLSKTNYSVITAISIGQTSSSFTLSEETKVCLTLVLVNGTQYNETNEVMIEKGSQATSYSPYFTPIELNKIGNYQDSIKKSTGKNLCDEEVLKLYFDASTHTLKSNDSTKIVYAKVPKNTNITISKTSITNRLRVGLSNTKPALNTEFVATSVWQDDTTNLSATINSSNYEYVIFQYTNQGQTTNVMINEGTTALTYEPYLPIGTWYIEKKIGKVVLDGSDSENWIRWTSQTQTNTCLFGSTILDNLIGVSWKGISNYFTNSTSTIWATDTPAMTIVMQQTALRIRIGQTQASDLTTLKSWLSTNKPIVYYILSTPTYTEITNTDLINQLESIELLNGINNITVTSPNVPGALKIHYNFKEAYTESDLVFCGVVKNTGNISLNPREPHFVDLQILDFKCLLSEGETLNYVINDKTIPEAIEQVVASISDYGFVIGNINILNPNDKINAYSTLNKTAYDVFQYIADVTQSKWATRVIDEDTIAIDFYDPTLMPQASPIQYNQTYFENNDIENMTFNYSTNDYRNKQIMTSDEVFGNIEQIETIISNGYQDTYTCQNKIGIIKKITVNDVECTFATKNEVELGVTADFEYQPGEMIFTSNQTYSAGAIIIITYYPIVKGREIILNSGESTRITNQINRKGTISRYENRNDTTSGQELIKIGQSYIKYKGSAEITLKIVSSKNLFNVGQIVEFNAPLEELSTEYMVKNKTIDIWTIDSNETQVFYTYELSSNFNSENAINYFDNQRAKNQGNIGEGETIVRNIDIENTALIQFYETNIEEVEISNISTLDFSLDAVLI